MSAPRQLPLPLPAKTALGREDYFVSQSNALAVALLENWSAWPGGKFLLIGPAGAGKTHLAHVWAALTGGRIISAMGLAAADVPAVSQGPVCIEDAHGLAGRRADEEACFHLHNLTLASGHPLLFTAQDRPNRWGLSLPDLQSRLEGAQSADLPAPDDALLSVLMAKLFADHQITPAADVIPYLVKHMPRDYPAAQAIVRALDANALARKSGITRPMAIEALMQLYPAAQIPDDMS